MPSQFLRFGRQRVYAPGELQIRRHITTSLLSLSSPNRFCLQQSLPMIEGEASSQPKPQKQIWSEQKQDAVHEEMRRMNQLPANSSYVTHRLKVLNKILQLISIQRTTSQEEELELLFAGLSL